MKPHFFLLFSEISDLVILDSLVFSFRAKTCNIFQLILEDWPAVVGPNYETEAVCLECLGRVDGSVLCHHCNLPLCSEQCRSGLSSLSLVRIL